MKRQLGVAEETFEQIRSGNEPTDFAAHLVLDLGDVVGSDVRKAAVFERGPDLLDGVEFGGIGREPFDVPAGRRGQGVGHAAVPVGAAEIPQEEQGPSLMAGEVAEEAEDVGPADIPLGMEGQVEGDPAAPRGDHEGADPRDLLVGPRAQGQRRGHPAKAPGAAKDRVHHKARFIEADQPGA